MKNYKKITPVLLIALTGVSVYTLFDTHYQEQRQYRAYLETAREKGEAGLTEDAIELYEQALAMNPDVKIAVEAGNVYVKEEQISDAVDWGESVVSQFPGEQEGYDFLLEQYLKEEDYGSCYALYEQAQAREAVSKKAAEIMEGIAYEYTFAGSSYEETGDFSEQACPVKAGETWGYIEETGDLIVSCQYEQAGAMRDGLAPVKEPEGDWYYIDATGRKKAVVEKIEDCTYLGGSSQGVILAADKEKYAFYNGDFKKLSGDYQDASSFSEGAAAVKKEEGWTYIDEEFKPLSDQTYDEVILDGNRKAFQGGRGFALRDGQCYLITEKGKEMEIPKAENARLFTGEDSYAAVCIGGKWGFCDRDGEIVIKPVYEDARSFFGGLAAVKTKGKWGFLDTSGKLVIPAEFEDAKDFNGSGCAFVRQDGVWRLLKLYRYNH